MKIEIYGGCIGGGMEVNGQDWEDMTGSDHKKLVRDLCRIFEKNGLSEHQIRALAECEGDYKMGETCEQCGDSPYTITWKVKW